MARRSPAGMACRRAGSAVQCCEILRCPCPARRLNIGSYNHPTTRKSSGVVARVLTRIVPTTHHPCADMTSATTTEVRGRWSVVGGRRPAVRGQRSEVRASCRVVGCRLSGAGGVVAPVLRRTFFLQCRLEQRLLHRRAVLTTATTPPRRFDNGYYTPSTDNHQRSTKM